MADTLPETPTAPFYESTRAFRNFKSIILLILVPAFAALPIWGMLVGVPRGHHAGGPYIFATILSIAFVAGFVKLIYNVATDVRETVRIDSTGVTQTNGRMIPWQQITAIRFDRAPFSNRGYLACELADQPGYFRSLRGQLPLTADDATQTLERIAEFLEKSDLRVKVLAPRKV